MKKKDLQTEHCHSFEISLAKLIAKEARDVLGYLSLEFGYGEPVFKITRIQLSDGTFLGVGGEHDFPYIEEGYGPNAEIFSQDLLDEALEATNERRDPAGSETPEN